MRRNHRRAFFHSPVVDRIDGEAVPVNKLGHPRFVGHVDDYALAFSHAKQRARDCAVVTDGWNDDAGSDLVRNRLDGELVGFASG